MYLYLYNIMRLNVSHVYNSLLKWIEMHLVCFYIESQVPVDRIAPFPFQNRWRIVAFPSSIIFSLFIRESVKRNTPFSHPRQFSTIILYKSVFSSCLILTSNNGSDDLNRWNIRNSLTVSFNYGQLRSSVMDRYQTNV